MSIVLGSVQERALRQAAASAITATAQELNPADGERAEQMAMVISEVFQGTPPAAGLTGRQTLLEMLQVGIAGQLAVLDDTELTGTGRSSAELLAVSGDAVAQALAAHLVREIVVRGSGGGPLAPLANQFNHDLTHLQGQRVEDLLAQVISNSDKVLRASLAEARAEAEELRQLLAARDDRLWNQRAEVYVEALTAVQYWQARRRQEVHFAPLDDDERRRIQATLATLKEPDWDGLKARLLAFASEPVYRAMQESNMAERYAIERFKVWQDADAAVMARPTEDNRKWRRVDFESAWNASMTAEGSANHVVEVIRAELQDGDQSRGNRI
jgi:hypothetical protein